MSLTLKGEIELSGRLDLATGPPDAVNAVSIVDVDGKEILVGSGKAKQLQYEQRICGMCWRFDIEVES